ncbi:hypothetical protein ACFWIB_01580 [Streptomyces sp. NPDC127051]|uniref:hypothetical protein n=1 Tax=Streptomyces sp. NPDC127051 TaxID=3347119 RepID=UPI003665C195
MLEAVFRELAGPLAPVGLQDSFYRGMRLAAVDGSVLDAPDTKVNRAAFGGPVKNGQSAGFPQVRVVTLTECGAHAQIDVAVGGFNGGERELAIALPGARAAWARRPACRRRTRRACPERVLESRHSVPV